MINWLKSQKIFWFLILGLLLIIGWIITEKYILANEQLENYLPADTTLAANLNLSLINTTVAQRDRLFSNPLISELINVSHQELMEYLKKFGIENWSPTWLQPQAIYFLTSDQNKNNWGLLAISQNNKIKKYFTNLPLSLTEDGFYTASYKDKNIYFSLVKNNIFLACSDKTICQSVIDRYQTTHLSPVAKLFSIISLKPFLTIKINKNLSLTNDNSKTLSVLNQIISPLNKKADNDINIELTQKNKYLGWQMSNYDVLKQPPTNNKQINDLLNQLQFEPKLLLGINNIQDFNNTISNNDLGQLLKKWVINYYWQDLSGELAKDINKPIILATTDQKSFFLITKSSELPKMETLIKSLLATFYPKNKTVLLPDGTLATELIADADRLVTSKNTVNDVEITKINNQQEAIYYYLQNDYLFISNNLDLLKINTKKRGSFNHSCWQNNSFSDVFYLNLQENNKNNQFHNIKEVAVWGNENNNQLLLKGCLAID